MPVRALDEFVDAVGRCKTAEQLFSAFRADVEAEGFQNIVFSQLGTGEGFEIPFLSVPDGAAGVYFSENFAEHDPVLANVKQSAAPFTWSEVISKLDLARPARRVMEVCRDIGLHSGITIPMHGPGRRCDLFSLSLRDKRSLDPARLNIITMKSYAVWLRYYEIADAFQFDFSRNTSSAPDSVQERATAAASHFDGSAAISQDECQALIITDIAHKRYRAGLPELNDKLSNVLGAEMFDRLKRRGLVFDEPDDTRWRYFARPSPIARSHLRTCIGVPGVRDNLWQLHVRMDERPVES
jgi:Autoinducer binding domain